MAEKDLSAVIDISADATGVEAGIGTAKKSISGFRAAVTEAGKASSDALAKSGDGAAAAAAKVDAATRSQVNSLQRKIAVTEAAGKGERAYQEELARQRGVKLDIIKPYLDQLDALKAKQLQAAQAIAGGSAALGTMGISAAQTAAALRGIPAQFTDIIVGLQGGQKPLTVLLQQGGQLKDMFGGAGNAAKALGGYVLDLVNPYALAAAAVGLVALAYYNGSKEAENYTKALILSGNVAGTTTSQLQDMSRALAEGNYTQGKSAEALASLVQSGAVGRADLQKFAAVAIDAERAIGQSLDKTAQAFTDLGKAPLQATLKLNESLHYLTLTTYEQIKSLEEQGRTTEAARVAQNAYADAIGSRSKQITENLGGLEIAWKGVGSFAAKAWDAMLGVGRPQTGSDQLASLKASLERLNSAGAPGLPVAKADYEKERQSLIAQIALIERLNVVQKSTAESDAQRVKLAEQKFAWDKQIDQFESNASKRQKEIAKATTEGQALIAAGLITEKDLRTQIANIEKKYTSPASGGESELAGIKARTLEQQRYLNLLRTQGAEALKLTDGEKLVIKIKQDLTTSISGLARADKMRSLAAAESQAAVDKQVEGELLRIDGLKKSKEAYLALIDQTQKSAQTLGTQADELAASNAMWGAGKVAIEQYRLALINAKLAEVEGGSEGSYDPAYVSALRLKAAEQARLVTQAQVADFKALNQQAQEYARTVGEEAVAYADEAKLAGMTTLERQKTLAIRKVDLEVAKQIAAIDRSGATEADKQALRDTVNATALQDKQVAVAKVVADEWNKTADSINQSLTDALLRGFEAGKGFAQNLRDTLVNMFKTLVLRPIISAVVNPVAQGVTSALGISGSGGAGGLLNTASNASSLYSAYTGITNGTGMVGGALSYASTALGLGASSGSAAVIAAGTEASAAAAAAGASAAEAAAAAGVASGTAATGTVAGGVTGALSAIPVYGWVALAAIAAYSIFGGKGGGPKQGSYAGTGVTSLADASTSDAAKAVTSSIEAGFKVTAAQLGDTTSQLLSGVAFAMDPQGTARTQLQVASTVNGVEAYNRGDRLGGIENVDRGNEALQAALADESIRAVYAGLEKSNIAQQIKDYLAGVDIGSDSKLLQQRINEALQVKVLSQAYAGLDNNLSKVLDSSTSASQALLTLFGGLDAFSSKFDSYYQNFYSDAERNAKTVKDLEASFATLGLALPTTRDGFRDLVDSQDLATASGQATYLTLLNLSGAFAAITPTADAAAAAVEAAAKVQADALQAQADAAAKAAAEIKKAFQSASDSIVAEVNRINGVLAGTGTVGYAAAQSQFAIATAQANAGDQTAAAALPGLSKTVLDLAASNVSTALDLKTIQAQMLASLQATNASLVAKYGLTVPSFAVGTNVVPTDMLAQIHTGERIIPAADNRELMQRLNGPAASGDSQAVLLRVEQLLMNISAETRSTAVSNTSISKVLQRVTPDGNSIAVQVVTA
ncbi:phage tail length tape measure family protein [Rhodoferax sp. WC2427]|uniref:phage tail length tape measure family protein n=1 Tax=Rhodoferax sp. WC2427 TaxID=3234144 RepID=UPI003467D70C